MPDWFDQHAPAAAAPDDWFAANAPVGRPVSAEDFLPAQPEGSATWRFLSNAGEMLNPVTMVQGAAHAIAHPIETGTAMLGAQRAEYEKAKALIKSGQYSEAAGHGLASALPLLGPAAAAAGEQIGSGDIAGGLGKGAGLLAPMAVGALAPKRISLPAVAADTAPGAADMLAFAEKSGVPVDAAAATGNKFVKAAQHVADRSLAGSVIAGKAAQAQAEGLATIGEQLAAKAHPVPVSASQAGEAAQQGVGGVVAGQRSAADAAYSRLREIEAKPENALLYQPEVKVNPDAPFAFTTKPNAPADDIFQRALADARANGYTGKVSDLRAKFDDRLESARNLKAATAEGDEYGPAALLREIRDRGGVRPFDKDFSQGAPAVALREESQAASQATRNRYGKNAVMRNDGLAIDDMHQQLMEDPKWGAVVGPSTDLRELIAKGDTTTLKPSGDIQGYLRGAGVHPGATWWNEGTAAKAVPMAVDLVSVKDAMRPLLDKLMAKREVAGALVGSEGTVAAKLHALVNGPDVAPLSVADSVLSDLKQLARTSNPNLRNPAQGLAAKAVGELHQMVGQAAERAGPDAVSALNEGRIATKAKYAAADVLKTLEGANRAKSGATAYRGLTQAGDTSIGHLKEVIAQAPDTKPLIGRAVLDGLIDHPTAGPAKTWSDWQKLGAGTKQALFAPDHIKDLDQFFALRKRLAENPNPSGTAHTMLTAGQAGLLFTEPVSGTAVQIGAGALSALLHSKAGVRLLTKGLTLPIRNTAAGSAWLADMMAATNPSGSPASPTPATAR